MYSTLPPDWKNRRRYSVLTFVTAIVLLSWGAFVTSINAGLAVPDWPTSFQSYDPFNPWPEWWKVTPVLAEHGHRLLGALIGLLTIGLAVWTWIRDDRRWMRWLGVAAVVLVSLQGVLGGLRVVWVSLDLAVVHACVAQLFFALLALMILFVSPAWRAAGRIDVHSTADDRRLLRNAMATPVIVYIQIILGALLRHPGTGLDPALAALHLGWAFVSVAAVVNFWSVVRSATRGVRPARRLANGMGGILAVQISLGLVAYFVLLDESGMIQPSNLQVTVNTLHMVVGALLFASTVAMSGLALRIRSTSRTSSIA